LTELKEDDRESDWDIIDWNILEFVAERVDRDTDGECLYIDLDLNDVLLRTF
jgi:hypothetical protein